MAQDLFIILPLSGESCRAYLAHSHTVAIAASIKCDRYQSAVFPHLVIRIPERAGKGTHFIFRAAVGFDERTACWGQQTADIVFSRYF